MFSNLHLTPHLGLFPETINQALFIAPCSHSFHYKCIKPLLEAHQPSFACPLCRTFANLDDDVEVEIIEPPSLVLDVTPAITPITPAIGGGLGALGGGGGGEDNLRTAAPDPGAETEVENDGTPGTGLRSNAARRRSFVPPVPAHGVGTAVTEVGEDSEMVDVSALPVLPEHDRSEDGESMDGVFVVGAMNALGGGTGAVQGGVGSRNRSAECLSEAGSGVAMQVDGEAGEAGSSEGSGRGSTEGMNTKRMR